MTAVELRMMQLSHGNGLPLPAYQTAGAAGMDLCAAVPADEPVTIPPGGRFVVPTGIALAIPKGFEGQVRPRSGLAVRYGVTVLNAPGTIDSDYRGEVQVILINFGDQPFIIERGARIAQLVITATMQADVCVVAILDETTRGPRGLGSTGFAADSPS